MSRARSDTVQGPAIPVARRTDDSGASPDAAAQGGVCPVENHAPCGGELSGTWSFAGLCPETPDAVPCESPFDSESACAGAGNEVACHIAAEGSVTFSAVEAHIVRNAVVEAQYTFTADCLAARTEPEPSDETVAYTLQGNELALGGELEASYCVTATRLTLDFEPHPQSWRYWVLTREQ
jgi:hypothetical protein